MRATGPRSWGRWSPSENPRTERVLRRPRRSRRLLRARGRLTSRRSPHRADKLRLTHRSAVPRPFRPGVSINRRRPRHATWLSRGAGGSWYCTSSSTSRSTRSAVISAYRWSIVTSSTCERSSAQGEPLAVRRLRGLAHSGQKSTLSLVQRTPTLSTSFDQWVARTVLSCRRIAVG